jgi:hypothetical protein
MSRSVLSRLVCGLFLTILSALPLAAAEPAGPATPRAGRLLSSLWSWLAELWREEGCYIDPYGCPGSTSSTPSEPAENENGCYIDPSGGCAPGPVLPGNSDAGCYIDPYGGCHS